MGAPRKSDNYHQRGVKVTTVPSDLWQEEGKKAAGTAGGEGDADCPDGIRLADTIEQVGWGSSQETMALSEWAVTNRADGVRRFRPIPLGGWIIPPRSDNQVWDS
jgi:hypothetical protein